MLKEAGRDRIQETVHRLVVQRSGNGNHVHVLLLLRAGEATGEVPEQTPGAAVVDVAGSQSIRFAHRYLEHVAGQEPRKEGSTPDVTAPRGIPVPGRPLQGDSS